MKFSIENEIFIPGPSLAAEKQGLGLKFSIENEIFKPRMKIPSENENFVRGGMVFSCVRARMNFFDPRALWVFSKGNLGSQSKMPKPLRDSKKIVHGDGTSPISQHEEPCKLHSVATDFYTPPGLGSAANFEISAAVVYKNPVP